MIKVGGSVVDQGAIYVFSQWKKCENFQMELIQGQFSVAFKVNQINDQMFLIIMNIVVSLFSNESCEGEGSEDLPLVVLRYVVILCITPLWIFYVYLVET